MAKSMGAKESEAKGGEAGATEGEDDIELSLYSVKGEGGSNTENKTAEVICAYKGRPARKQLTKSSLASERGC